MEQSRGDNSNVVEEGDGTCCSGCHMLLHEPYVQCQGCKEAKVLICTACFSKGREFGSHRSNHDFSVVKNNFSLFAGGGGGGADNAITTPSGGGGGWTANEELLLLNGVLKFG